MQNSHFTINQDASQGYFYRLHNEQNRIILTGEKCGSKTTCLRAIELVRKYAVDDQAYLRIYALSSNRFVLHAGNDKQIGHSGQFPTMRAKEQAIGEVKSIAPAAPIIDLTG